MKIAAAIFISFAANRINMTVSHACLMIVVAAAGGWALASLLIYLLFKPATPLHFLGLRIWGVLPYLQQRFAKELAESLAERYLQPEQISAHLNDQTLLKQLTPEIENHIDVFMEQKLPETFPLLSKLMGEKTLAKFKGAFLQEVEVIFPAMIGSYSGKVVTGLQPAIRIEQALKEASLSLLQTQFERRAAAHLRSFKLLAAIAAGLIALVQWVLLEILL